jgi:NADPH:quinone reductase-like Zn-dependent oxidoreductase
MPTNRAAWITSKSAKTLEVKSAPYTPPGQNEIVVKNRAIAINPVDWFKLDAGNTAFTWIKYPTVIGADFAGEAAEVGTSVTRFKVGDRVLGQAVCLSKNGAKSSEGAFQEYTVIRSNLASPIPSFLSFENACVLPLTLSTAACGLYQKDYLALPFPTILPQPTGKTLLVWGGSTSVGSNAIQLALASGLEVITTAGPKNFDYVKKLGAVMAFDYRAPTSIKDIIQGFKGRDCAGAIAIGNGSLNPCLAILTVVEGRKFVSQASVATPDEWPSGQLSWASFALSMGWENLSTGFRSKVNCIEKKFIFGSDLMGNGVDKAIFEDFLPAALARGAYIAAPEPLVIGTGLEKIQEALSTNKKGVSAKKVVVSL